MNLEELKAYDILVDLSLLDDVFNYIQLVIKDYRAFNHEEMLQCKETLQKIRKNSYPLNTTIRPIITTKPISQIRISNSRTYNATDLTIFTQINYLINEFQGWEKMDYES